MTNFYGDFSNHDWTRGSMDVAAMAADGIQGGFHKLSDGLNYYIDPYFQTAINRMKSSTFKFYGAYHVMWGNRDIPSQVDWMISLLDQKCSWWRSDPKFRIMSDDEPFTYNVKPSIAQINQFHDVFLTRVNKPQFAYAPRWTYGSSVTGIHYPVTASNYGSNPNVHYPTGYPGDTSSRWADSVLQFGSLLIQGNQNQTDCNAVRDANVWNKLVGGNDMQTFKFEITDRPGAQYIGVPGAGFYAARDPGDFQGENLIGPYTSVMPAQWAYDQVKQIFGPEIQWEPVAGPPGKDGINGTNGIDGKDAVLKVGDTVQVVSIA